MYSGNALLMELADILQAKALTAAAYFHAEFEDIHLRWNTGKNSQQTDF